MKLEIKTKPTENHPIHNPPAGRGWLFPSLAVFTPGGIFGFIYEELFCLIDLGYLVKRGRKPLHIQPQRAERAEQARR